MSDYSPGTVFDLDLDLDIDLDTLAGDFDFSTIPDTVGGSPESEASKKRPARTLAPNLTRRSHKKSRGGCFSCKARKIKCQETRPACENCVGKELDCKYPSRSDQRIIRRPTNTSRPSDTTVTSPSQPRLDVNPLSPPTTFTMADMRCFHHYMAFATPHLPLGNDSVWINQVPEIAQDNEYLMHAILALGASHLTRVSQQQDFNTNAIVHRGKAIKGLNDALARDTDGDSDAMLAACYALTFQASYMGDGMADFIAMVRGCALLSERMNRSGECTAFKMGPDAHVGIMVPRLDRMPPLDPALIIPGIVSTENLRPLLATETDTLFHASLLRVLYALQESSKAGYMNFIGVYGTFFDMSHTEFAQFVDPANLVGQLLMAHFIGLQMLMMPLTMVEINRVSDASQARVLLGMADWADRIVERTPPGMEGHLQWMRCMIEGIKHDVGRLVDGSHRTMPLKILAGRLVEEEAGDLGLEVGSDHTLLKEDVLQPDILEHDILDQDVLEQHILEIEQIL